MTPPSWVLVSAVRTTRSRVGQFVLVAAVLVSALCHLSQNPPGTAEHDGAHSHSVVSVEASENWAVAGPGVPGGGGGEHSCEHDGPMVPSPQALVHAAVVTLPALDGAPAWASGSPSSPFLDAPRSSGPRPYVLCVLRT